MIIVKKQGEKWSIVKGEASRVPPFRTNFRFWTGESWESLNFIAKLFDTEEEARAYLAKNRGALEQ